VPLPLPLPLGFDHFMSIRNATIAMRKRKIGLFEQERIAILDEERRRRRGVQSKVRKEEASQAKPHGRHRPASLL
jgi:hypothetical protein